VKSLRLFLVDRTIPGITSELLVEAQKLLHNAAHRVSTTGETVHYLRCTFVPNEQRCICLFGAYSSAAVLKVNEIAQVPFRRIESAVEFTMPGNEEVNRTNKSMGRTREASE
jgi:hypothetical protein